MNITQHAREAAEIIERIKADPGHPAERSLPEIIQTAIDRASIDPERVIKACVPGGYSCDPQAVADALREYLGGVK